jgi:tetratricopeptide (TPR) repeat protein
VKSHGASGSRPVGLAFAEAAARSLALALMFGAATGAFYEWGGAAARGVRQLKKKQDKEAVGSLREGRRELPRSAAVRYDQALAFQGAGLRDSALQAYGDAMTSQELRGDDARAAAAYNLGNEVMREGNPDFAKRFYRESLRVRPNRIDAKKNLEEAIRRSRNRPTSPPRSGSGGGGQRPETGAGTQQPGAPPPEQQGESRARPGESSVELGREIPSRAEAEHWLDALESEREAAREREHAGGEERGQRDW